MNNIDPRLLSRLQQNTKVQKRKNKNYLADYAKKFLSGVGTAKSVLSGMYNIIEAPTYYSLKDLR